MSRRVLITFSGVGYDDTTRRIVEDGPRFGASDVFVYDDAWLVETEFYRVNRWLWDVVPARCFGYCAWKPYIILHSLDRCEPGDVVLYVDGDTYPVADLSPVYEIASRDGAAIFNAAAHQNRQWCKRDAYVVMGQDEQRYHESKAGSARYCAFQRGPWKPTQLLYEWLTYSVNRLANTKARSVLGPELDGFVEGRDEQAILTLLAHKHGFRLWREACDSGEGFPEDRDVYGQLFQSVNQGDLVRPMTGSKYRRLP